MKFLSLVNFGYINRSLNLCKEAEYLKVKYRVERLKYSVISISAVSHKMHMHIILQKLFFCSRQ